MVRVLAAVRTLVYVIVFVLAWGWLAHAAQRLDRHLGLELPSWLPPLGYLLAAAGAVLVLVCLSPSALLLAAAAWLLAHALAVLYEEPTLRRRFGASYECYALEVNRWLPRRPRAGDA
jgi:protein-S-isoprenylcysteine O-methyltransferase Ste14